MNNREGDGAQGGRNGRRGAPRRRIDDILGNNRIQRTTSATTAQNHAARRNWYGIGRRAGQPGRHIDNDVDNVNVPPPPVAPRPLAPRRPSQAQLPPRQAAAPQPEAALMNDAIDYPPPGGQNQPPRQAQAQPQGQPQPQPQQRPSITREQIAAWLASEQGFTSDAQNPWRGVKFLGRGGFGIVGLWERQNPAGEPYRVVVKQQFRHHDALRREARTLALLSSANSKHVVRLIAPYREAIGTGSSEWDPADKVSRIYLEFCKNGDLSVYMRSTIYRLENLMRVDSKFEVHDNIPEAFIWKLFECLARAVCVLDNGQENPDGPRRFPQGMPAIVHLDMKNNNVLVGDLDDDQHTQLEALKFADFGLSFSLPWENASQATIEAFKKSGTPDWRAPEQIGHTNAKWGSFTNTWQIGKIMYWMLCSTNDREFYTRQVVNYSGDVFETYGAKWQSFINYNYYSETLMSTIFKCLASDPSKRPEPHQLVKDILEAQKTMVDTIESISSSSSGSSSGSSSPENIGAQPPGHDNPNEPPQADMSIDNYDYNNPPDVQMNDL